MEAVGQLDDAVAVAHPDRQAIGQPLEERVGDACAAGALDHGMAVLVRSTLRHLAAELVGQELHAVADAQHRHPALEDIRGRLGGIVIVDAGGAAGEDEGARL